MAVTEKLIQTVHAYPVLYNVSLHDYRSAERRVKAWREVAASVGLSGQCVNITRAFDFKSVIMLQVLKILHSIYTARDATN